MFGSTWCSVERRPTPQFGLLGHVERGQVHNLAPDHDDNDDDEFAIPPQTPQESKNIENWQKKMQETFPKCQTNWLYI